MVVNASDNGTGSLFEGHFESDQARGFGRNAKSWLVRIDPWRLVLLRIGPFLSVLSRT